MVFFLSTTPFFGRLVQSFFTSHLMVLMSFLQYAHIQAFSKTLTDVTLASDFEVNAESKQIMTMPGLYAATNDASKPRRTLLRRAHDFNAAAGFIYMGTGLKISF
jgi:hypothetical protein